MVSTFELPISVFSGTDALPNFVKPHKSLRLEIKDGGKKWKQRTPAMAEGLTDHVWSLSDLLCFRIPVS